MRIIVISDTHGDVKRLRSVVLRHKSADLFLHLGDGAKEYFLIKSIYPDLPFIITRGNCDFEYPKLPSQHILNVCSHIIFASHGHEYGVKGGFDHYVNVACKSHADIILYGHTHEKLTKYQNNIYIMNPGSLSRPRDHVPSYGIIDIIGDSVITNVVEYKN